MKKTLRLLVLIACYAIAISLGLSMTSCGGDEPEIPDTPVIPDTPDDPKEDPQKYDIVGVWETYYKWAYSGITQHITLDIKTNGTLSCSSTDDYGQDPWYGTGSWTYSNNSWSLLTGSSMISGKYIIVNGQLICNTVFEDGSSRTVTYNRISGGNGTQGEQDYKSMLIKHKTWTWDNGQYDNGFFTFYGTNNVQFLQSGSSKVGSYGIPNLDARGTFSINGNKLECTYVNISIDPSNASNQFPNWKIGSTRKITYSIDKLTDTELILKDGNIKYTLKPLY